MAPGTLPDSTLTRCAVCGSNEIRHWFETAFGTMGRCSLCGQVLRSDQPKRDEHVALHQTSNLHESSYALNSELAACELAFYHRFLELGRSEYPGGRILDVGCGAGEFLKLAFDEGFDVLGIEPTSELREIAQQKVGNINFESRALEDTDFENESFNGVMMSDVLEHLVDPRGALQIVFRLLKPGGSLALATLNHSSLMYDIYHILRKVAPSLSQQFAELLYNPFHTYYFSKQSLARLVRATGFEIIEQRGYEYPVNRLNVGSALKLGMRGLYVVQGLVGREGEQYIFAKKP